MSDEVEIMLTPKDYNDAIEALEAEVVAAKAEAERVAVQNIALIAVVEAGRAEAAALRDALVVAREYINADMPSAGTRLTVSAVIAHALGRESSDDT